MDADDAFGALGKKAAGSILTQTINIPGLEIGDGAIAGALEGGRNLVGKAVVKVRLSPYRQTVRA
jgi:hypothetical protein